MNDITIQNEGETLDGVELALKAIAEARQAAKKPRKRKATTDNQNSGVTGVTASHDAASAANAAADSDCSKTVLPVLPVLPASNDGALSGNTDENPRVTRVTSTADSDEEAEEAIEKAMAPRFPSLEDRPRWVCYSSLETWPRDNKGKKRNPGVYYHYMKETDEGPVLTDDWLCTPLFVDAIASDGAGRDFGRLLIIEDIFKMVKQWCMPMRMLSGKSEELQSELFDMGWVPDPKERGKLIQYLLSQHPETRVKAVGCVGWSDTRSAFVTPVTVVGDEGIFYQSAHPGTGDYATSGSMEAWQREVAALAVGNPVLTMAIGLALAGPLLAFFDVQGGGIHFWADSSVGKTSALEVCCSVFGSPVEFRRTWLTTSNGLEGIASLRNDTCLVLDEINSANPHDVGDIVYAIANGTGKQRAKRNGNAAESKRWRLMVMSNGEKSLETIMAAAGHRTTAGQDIRLPSIHLARAYGAWDNLHHFGGGAAMSDHLSTMSRKHYGHAGMAFIKALLKSPPSRDGFRQIEEGFKTDHGQTTRVGKRFALIAYAGELAAHHGIVPWEPGVATEGAFTLFQAWLAGQRTGNHEQAAILEALREYLEVHGEGRFTSKNLNKSDDETGGVPDRLSHTTRAGWYEYDPAKGKGYRFTAAGLVDAVPGFDKKRVVRALIEAGLWPEGTKRAEQDKVPIQGNVRLWPPVYLEDLQDES